MLGKNQEAMLGTERVDLQLDLQLDFNPESHPRNASWLISDLCQPNN